jgi:hypothetical protein
VAPLEHGLLLPKHQALSLAPQAEGLEGLASGLKAARLSSEMIPAWVARAVR